MRGRRNIRRLALTAILLLTLVGYAQAGLNHWTNSLTLLSPEWEWQALTGSVAIDPFNPDIAFAATHAGVFKTTDRGQSWTLVDAFPNASAVAINPRNPANVVTGNYDTSGPEPSDTRLRRSVDGGLTWEEAAPLNEYEQFVHAIVFDPSQPAAVYAGLRASGVGKSVDGGKTWTVSDHRNGLICCVWDFFDTTDVAIDRSDRPTIYASAFMAGLFRSTDSAASWQQLRLPSGDLGDVRTITVDPNDPKRLYVTGFYRHDPYVLTSADGGSSWDRLPFPAIAERIAVDPVIPTTLYAAYAPHTPRSPVTSGGILRSTDRGATWTEFNDGLEGQRVSSVTIDSTGTLLYAFTGDGVYVYDQRPAFRFDRLPEDGERLPRLLGQVVAREGSSASAANAFILPVAGAVRGAGGQTFGTEVSLANSRADEQDVVLAWLAQGNTRGPAVPMFRVTLPAASEEREGMLAISNLPGSLGLEGLGSIVVVAIDGEDNADPGAEIYGFARVWSPAGCGSGTTSQSLSAVAGEAFGLAARARALGLRQDGAYRTNVGIVNLDKVAREFTVLAAGERHAERFTISVQPYSLSHTAVPDRAYGSLALTVTAGRGAGPWTAYGSSVDNASGDGWAAVAMPLLTN